MTDSGANESFSVSLDADGTFIASGDIDLAAGPILEAAVGRAVDGGPVVIDLTSVTFIDSSGLRSLLTATRRAGEHDTYVVLRSPSAEVRRLLDITGTAGQFRIDDAGGSDGPAR